MKKFIYTTLGVAGALSFAACDDYLDTSSPSIVDADFVFSNTTTARAALEGGYEAWRSTANSCVFGAGLFYAADIAGSDIERHPEAYANQAARHIPESLYGNGTQTEKYDIDSYSSNNNSGTYTQLYNVIGKANAVIQGMEESSTASEVIKSGEQSAIGQLYGEAVALRATAYRELLKYYGDVPFVTVFGEESGGLASRDSIYDCIIADLIKVEPLMYPVGSIPNTDSKVKNYFSQTYVDGLIGRLALEAAGYQTRRADMTYVDGEGNPVQFETLGKANANAANAFYARRSDYKDLYETAKTYFKAAIDHAGTAKFYTTDPRSTGKAGQAFNNPFQYFFQQMMEDDATYADESIYEYPMQYNVTSDERTYSSGRPGTGGSKNAYPCKCYGQARINPAYYYGIFDPNDMRRDVTATVTGTTAGTEIILPFTPGSQAKGGGIALNKWDDNRMTTPNTVAQRKSGINGPYMRMSEIYLGYAEACAVTGDEGEAKTYLKLIRERSFPTVALANTDKFISDCGSLFNAIIEERGFEYAGEGDRRFTLIRTGRLPWAIKRIKELTTDMLDGIKANGSYTFANGNVISDYIYTKAVDAQDSIGYRLTTQCTDETNPITYPGWRGVNDDWSAFGWTANTATTNLAIQGLFAAVADGAALEADGYTKTSWGQQLLDNRDEYEKYLFYLYDYESAPIYLWPISPNAVAMGGFSNGYGFQNE
ncbi:MAG: RagB/SusD family nutrient uptake outer membrane protein [Bacteroidales bacterium]|nr:RagB/SusD family nutrient uptake outer membrane protein [Bacteroidales bacterium]